jgi:hypothetical protein
MTVTKQSTVLLMWAEGFFPSLSKVKEHCISYETMWANKEKKPNFTHDCSKNTPFYTFSERIDDRRREVRTTTITCFTCCDEGFQLISSFIISLNQKINLHWEEEVFCLISINIIEKRYKSLNCLNRTRWS